MSMEGLLVSLELIYRNESGKQVIGFVIASAQHENFPIYSSHDMLPVDQTTKPSQSETFKLESTLSFIKNL